MHTSILVCFYAPQCIKAMKADNHMESNVRVRAALRCPGNLTAKSRGQVPQWHTVAL